MNPINKMLSYKAWPRNQILFIHFPIITIIIITCNANKMLCNIRCVAYTVVYPLYLKHILSCILCMDPSYGKLYCVHVCPWEFLGQCKLLSN